MMRMTRHVGVEGQGSPSLGIYSWYDLSWREQREVVRLARQGLQHPDRRAARVAQEWAQETLAGGSLMGIAFVLMLSFLTHSDAGVSLADRRKAKKILRVSDARHAKRSSAPHSP